MLEIIVPEDGLLYKTSDGQPILQIAKIQESSILRLFSNNEESTVLLGCHNEESAVFIGKGNKSLTLTTNEVKNELRFTNEYGKVTTLLYSDEKGGQFEICDSDANSLISMGINSDGNAAIFIRGKNGEFIIALYHNKTSGAILLQDENGSTVWSSEDI